MSANLAFRFSAAYNYMRPIDPQAPHNQTNSVGNVWSHGKMPSINSSHQVLGTAMVTVALLAPAAVAPQEMWAQLLMVAQVLFMTWLVIRRPQSDLL
ncbi:MAG: hypothetical protein ACKOW5_13245 [Actinomycetales bacterium]